MNELDGIDLITIDEKTRIEKLIQETISMRTKPFTEGPVVNLKPVSMMMNTSQCRLNMLKCTNLPSMKVMFTNADQLTTSKMTELRKKIEPLNLDSGIGRGIAVYSHLSIEKSTIQIDTGLSYEEVCLLEMRLRGRDIACCYKSPTKTQTSDHNNEKLIQLIKHISSKNYTHKCIVGDLNLRNINWLSLSTTCGENSTEVVFLEAVRDSYLYQHVEHATRRRGNDDPSLIDLIFTDEEMQVSDVSHHSPLGKSDHSVITFNYHCYLDYAKASDRYNYRNSNSDGMKQHLENSNWN